ncbi:MAG: phytanoyl-CoA dioxygenase, partial [Alphaproteobacteria bacterium]|nr:phytanoyl-CoA dioxygenase [Alphaproteobacteria bacterium]
MTALALYEAPPVDYGDAEAEMVRYREAGTARALALDNRGPLRFGLDGALEPAILESYWRHGFYVFERVLDPEELADIERDLADLLDRAPASPGADTDRHGQPAFDHGRKGRGLGWVKPLSDPVGGTDYAFGRHPAKMLEPEAPDGAPSHVLQLIHGSLQYSEACLRLYG